MATVGSNYLTLAEVTQQYGVENPTYKISSLLARSNPMFADMPWIQANGTDSHTFLQDVSLPEISVGQFNEGVGSTKGSGQPVIEPMMFNEARSDVDVKILNRAKDPELTRFTEDKRFMQSFANTFEETIFYGNSKKVPGQINGLANRYNSLSGNFGSQVVDCSNSNSGGDYTSVYVVTWGDAFTYGIYPQNEKAGLQMEDEGTWNKTVNNKVLKVAGTKFTMHYGLSVANWKNNARLANIDISQLSAVSPIDLIKKIKSGISKLQFQPQNFAPLNFDTLGKGNEKPAAKFAIYMNQTVYDFLDNQANELTKYGLGKGEAFGSPYYEIRGIPIRVSGGIANNEDAVA